MPSTSFSALPGFYNILFLHLEPISTILPAIFTWSFPGATWFFNELIPGYANESSPLDPRSSMAVMQLTNCYLLLGLISSLVFRAIRDSLPHDPAAQERILGASLTALAIADVTHILVTLIGLPPSIRYSPQSWNSMTHGNITTVVLLLSGRLAWFLGIGRKRYYYGTSSSKKIN